jgi:hypothetical protein
MNKTISSITPTQHYHPAVGRLYSIIFSDSTTSLVYEETFFHQFENYHLIQYLDLVGKELNTSEDFFDFKLVF